MSSKYLQSANLLHGIRQNGVGGNRRYALWEHFSLQYTFAQYLTIKLKYLGKDAY